jgi:hypothetical protein
MKMLMPKGSQSRVSEIKSTSVKFRQGFYKIEMLLLFQNIRLDKDMKGKIISDIMIYFISDTHFG